MDIHSDTQAMSFDWQPDEALVEQIALRIGLIDFSYDDDQLGEFVMYWIGQSTRWHTTYQWTLKFVQSLKFKKTAFRQKDTKVVGTQLVPKEAGISIDPNTRSLLEQYGNHDD